MTALLPACLSPFYLPFINSLLNTYFTFEKNLLKILLPRNKFRRLFGITPGIIGMCSRPPTQRHFSSFSIYWPSCWRLSYYIWASSDVCWRYIRGISLEFSVWQGTVLYSVSIMSCPVLSCPVLPCPVLSYLLALALSLLIRSYPSTLPSSFINTLHTSSTPYSYSKPCSSLPLFSPSML